METLWGITAAVVATAIGVGFGVPRDYWTLAVGSFVLAGGMLGVVGFMWLVHTPTSLVLRIAAGTALGLVVFVVIPLFIRATWPPSAAQEQPVPTPDSTPPLPQVTITGGDNVVSVGQIGGITARVVTINPPVQPEFRIIDKNDLDNADGSHTVTIVGEVAAPFTPGLLAIQVRADGMRFANVAAVPVNGVSMTQKRNILTGKDFYSAEIPAPRGQYVITVTTDKLTNVHLDASF